MTPDGVLDLELAVRVGVPDRATRAAIERIATDAFLWRRRSQAESLDIARGLQWLAAGGAADPTSEQVVAALALSGLDEDRRRALGVALDAAVASCPPPATRPGDGAGPDTLGRHIALALDLLRAAEPDEAG